MKFFWKGKPPAEAEDPELGLRFALDSLRELDLSLTFWLGCGTNYTAFLELSAASLSPATAARSRDIASGCFNHAWDILEDQVETRGRIAYFSDLLARRGGNPSPIVASYGPSYHDVAGKEVD